MLCFEFPVAERTRSLLRLEQLYERLDFFINGDTPFEHHAALQTLFELLETASRADLKADLLQELERQKQMLDNWRNNPAIDETMLESTLEQIESVSGELLGVTGKFGSHIRENEWLMAIRQRSNIPGGTCQFDLPSYFLWQQKPVEDRREDIMRWIAPLLPTAKATRTLLKLLRESGKSHQYVARQGAFQQMSGGKVVQLLRVMFDEQLNVLPELSANKYMLNIRFIHAATGEVRAKQTDQDVEFNLLSCKF